MDKTIIKVIDGLCYSTKTATKICSFEPDCGRSDFRFERTSLFRTPKGRFFIAGFGGPMSPWRERCGNNTYREGEGLTPVDVEVARSFAELHADVATVVKFFEVEDA